MAVIGSDFVMQSRRTLSAEDDAQVRQLLVAGEEIARSRLTASKSVDDSIPLPKILADRQAHLSIQALSTDSASRRSFAISADLPHRSMSQRVSYSFQDGRWILTSAELSD